MSAAVHAQQQVSLLLDPALASVIVAALAVVGGLLAHLVRERVLVEGRLAILEERQQRHDKLYERLEAMEREQIAKRANRRGK